MESNHTKKQVSSRHEGNSRFENWDTKSQNTSLKINSFRSREQLLFSFLNLCMCAEKRLDTKSRRPGNSTFLSSNKQSDMDTESVRRDYLQIGLNSKECLKIFESTKQDDTMQLVVGDHSGVLQSHKVRGGQILDPVFKTMPGPNLKISAVEMANGSAKVFASVGSLMIRGLNRKGKQFFGLELNNLTEPIEHLKIRWPTDIFVCGKYIYNHYVLSPTAMEANIVQMKDSYICPGTVSAMIVLSDHQNHVPVLACQDRLLRMLRDSKCEFELESSGVPISLVNLSHAMSDEEFGFCYGSSDGKVTMIGMKRKAGSQPHCRWDFPESGVRSPVESLAASSLGKEIAVGRSDGTIEVWCFNGTLNLDDSENVDIDSVPFCRFTFNCNESVTSLCISRDSSLIVACTFAGSVFGLQCKHLKTSNQKHLIIFIFLLQAGKGPVTRDSYRSNDSVRDKIEALQEECHVLELNIAAEVARSNEQETEYPESSSETSAMLSLHAFAVKESMTLCDDASHVLSIEAAVAIDTVIVQCDVPLDLIDSEKNSAVVSFTETETSEILATFRCQTNTTRLEIQIRSVEGQYGVMRVYIMNRQSPKSCQLKVYQIRPLSLHKRVHSQVQDSRGDPSRLEVRGDFSVYEANNWVSQSLPEVPDQIASRDGVAYHFKSTLSATSLTCTIAKGSIVFESDNVSSISILKDFITRQATRTGVKIELSTDVSEGSIGQALERLYPLVKRLVLQKAFTRLKKAVDELSETDAEVAASLAKDLEEEYGSEPELKVITLDRVYGLITDLFIDQHKLRGTSSKSTLFQIKNKVKKLAPVVEGMFLKKKKAEVEEFVQKLLQFWTLAHQ